MIQVFESTAASERLAHAAEFIRAFPASTEVLILANSREAADDFVRGISRDQHSSFGLHRFSLTQLAARLASVELAIRGLAHTTSTGALAIASRTAFGALQDNSIRYFEPVARYPGFIRALASTLTELRLSAVQPTHLRGIETPGPELASLLEEYERQLVEAAVADRLILFDAATRAVETVASRPLLLLDLEVDSRAEAQFVKYLAEGAPAVLATVPAGDWRTVEALGAASVQRTSAASATNASSLGRLRHFLFSKEEPPKGDFGDEVHFFSAPGEGRECVEIARRMLREARAGVPFDHMAVLLRAPETYSGLLQSALDRARIPAHFARGTKRPDPTGRAFLALLACAVEGLSAKRFAEYLSFGQVPGLDSQGGPPTDRMRWVPAGDESLGVAAERLETTGSEEGEESPATADPSAPGENVRAPWRWEKLLVDAAVVGGMERWERRLKGLRNELQVRLEERAKREPESPQLGAVRRNIEDLGCLERFALPVIGFLGRMPTETTWGDWLKELERLAPMTLGRPDRVLSALAELRPMAAVGPVTLERVAEVLHERLSNLQEDPPKYRFGRVFVATAEQVRGRCFDVVFIPGLAERVFPRRPREDPMLLDRVRKQLGVGLRTQDDRGYEERQRLRLAVGAARQRVYFSYPRVEVAQSRARVPSFYGLDIARATRGQLPSFEDLVREGDEASEARLAWPAPRVVEEAIDDAEHDLAVLAPLLTQKPSSKLDGQARYLLELNGHLRRSLNSRYMRWEERRWSSYDGIVRVTSNIRDGLESQRLAVRPYSVSALQHFSACPYRFLLSAIYHLTPRDEAIAIEQLDPLTRGHMFHRVQAELLRELERKDLLPVKSATLGAVFAIAGTVLDRVAERYRDDLCPAILRVWQDEIESMRGDLRLWLAAVAEEREGWVPIRFELGFGLPGQTNLDPRSTPDPVRLPTGALLRGSVDLVERRAGGRELRVTDHKTGRDRTNREMIVQGGAVLQPVLYSLVLETMTGDPVSAGRLFYCTAAGGLVTHTVEMNALAREHATEVLTIIDEAVSHGQLHPAPAPQACEWCDYRPVCGPYEERRMRDRKDSGALRHLDRLRGMQ